MQLISSTPLDISNQDVKQIRDCIAQWQKLFSPGAKRYTLDGYEHLFVNNNELLVFDNFASDNTRFTGFDTYRKIWEQSINEDFPNFVMYHIEVDRIEVSRNLAWSALTWWGRITKNSETQYSSQHCTHIWHKHEGQWEIVHEHLSGTVKENGTESSRQE